MFSMKRLRTSTPWKNDLIFTEDKARALLTNYYFTPFSSNEETGLPGGRGRTNIAKRGLKDRGGGRKVRDSSYNEPGALGLMNYVLQPWRDLTCDFRATVINL